MFNISPSLFAQANDCITIEFLLSGGMVVSDDEWLEKERLRHRLLKRKQAAAKAVAEGREPNLDFDRPKAPLLTEDEKRDHRRVKQNRWRANNLEKSRQIVRDSEKRRAAKRAISEGREPGKIGVPKKFTEAEKRAKRKAKTEAYNAAHLDDVREKAKLRERAKRAGTFVSKALPRLTDEERTMVNRAMAANRRARLRGNGGRYTKEDIARLFEDQNGICPWCNEAFGAEGFHVDHRIPVIRGGPNDPSNLQLLHPVCNLKKGAKLLEEQRPGKLAEPVGSSIKGD